MSGRDNPPAWIVLRLGKWETNTGWHFGVTPLKGARLSCRKAITFRGLLMCNPYRFTSPTHLAVPGCMAAVVQKSPCRVWVCRPRLCLLCVWGSQPVLSAGPALCRAAPACWLTRLLQSVTVDSFPIKNWLLNSKLNCCSDLAVKSHRGSPDTALCVRICLFTAKGINKSPSEGWKPGPSYTESLCLFSWKNLSLSPKCWGE